MKLGKLKRILMMKKILKMKAEKRKARNQSYQRVWICEFYS
jgi:hypothetical protein